MNARPIFLTESTGTRLASLDVAFRDSHFRGTLSVETLPPHLAALFAEFEQTVEGQMFSLLDDIEERIAALTLHVAFDDGTQAPIADLQVYPARRAISFKLRQPAGGTS